MWGFAFLLQAAECLFLRRKTPELVHPAALTGKCTQSARCLYHHIGVIRLLKRGIHAPGDGASPLKSQPNHCSEGSPQITGFSPPVVGILVLQGSFLQHDPACKRINHRWSPSPRSIQPTPQLPLPSSVKLHLQATIAAKTVKVIPQHSHPAHDLGLCSTNSVLTSEKTWIHRQS